MELLALADLLVDGPFLAAEYDENLISRGSANQRVIRLSERYSPDRLQQAMTAQGKGFSIQVRADGGIAVNGLQERAGAAAIEKKLRAMD